MIETMILLWALGACATGFVMAAATGARHGAISPYRVDDLIAVSLSWPVRVAGYAGFCVGYAIRAMALASGWRA